MIHTAFEDKILTKNRRDIKQIFCWKTAKTNFLTKKLESCKNTVHLTHRIILVVE